MYENYQNIRCVFSLVIVVYEARTLIGLGVLWYRTRPTVWRQYYRCRRVNVRCPCFI